MLLIHTSTYPWVGGAIGGRPNPWFVGGTSSRNDGSPSKSEKICTSVFVHFFLSLWELEIMKNKSK